jgi:hypothetical protein
METIKTTDSSGNPVTIPVTEELIKAVLKSARKSGRADKRFDINLVEGQLAETELLKMLGDSTIELKTDFYVSKSGNVAIETMCRNKPSGITATEADFWAIKLEGPKYNGDVTVLIKTDRLKTLLDGCRFVSGGDGNRSDMFLVPVEKLVSA